MSEKKDSIKDLWGLIVRNDHDGIRSFVSYHNIEGSTSFKSYCDMPGCGCISNVSIINYLKSMGSCDDFGDGYDDWKIPVTTETFALLFELGIIKRDNIKFLYDYIRTCNREARWKSLLSIIPMFSKDAMISYRSDYNQTILYMAFHMLYFPEDMTEWYEFIYYLLDVVGIDPKVCTHDPEKPNEFNDETDTVMISAIIGQHIPIIRKLHNMGLDINEFYGYCYLYHRTPIMTTAHRICKMIVRGEKVFNQELDHDVYEHLSDQEITTHLEKLYSTLILLRDLGYDFTVRNYRRPSDVHCYKPKKYNDDSKFGYTLGDILRKWNIAERDSRFAEFY
jgi:hypothetical protein